MFLLGEFITISLTFFIKKLILQFKGLSQNLLGDIIYFIYKVVTFFNKIFKAIYIKFKAVYRLKIIIITSFIINKLLGLIYTFIITFITTSITMSVVISIT